MTGAHDSDRTWGPFAPIFVAELTRGNRTKEYLYDWQGLRGDLPEAYFKYPMDLAALQAEFDFGDRVRLVDEPGKRRRLEDAVTGYVVYDGRLEPGWWARRLRRSWWREWERHPRPRRCLSVTSGGSRG